MSHFVIIDGHHLMYRAYWAIPRTMITTKGEHVNAVFGVASMIIQILKTEQPDGVVFCFDAGEETFRHKEYKEYKSGRVETPDDFYVQIPRILEVIRAFGFKYVSDGGYEADDFACSYALAASKAGERVTIISGDRDLLQLASRHVRIAIPAKAYQAPEYLDPDAIKAKYGVTPEQIPSYKGLVGDSSDNLKGVAGIGPVAAAALLQEFGTLKNLYENLDRVSKTSLKAKLIAGREQAFFCERLATLKCDLPLPLPLTSLSIGSTDLQSLLSLFHDLEFSMLRKRVQSFAETPYGRGHFSVPDEVSATSRVGGRGAKVEENVDGVGQLSLL